MSPPPTVTIACPAGVQTGPFSVEVDFSEFVTGFEQADLKVGNGRVTAWAESGGSTLAGITPSASGTVTLDVPANVAVDGGENGNLAAQQCSVHADLASVSIANASASEGNQIEFTVTLDQAVTGGLTVTPSFTDVTAAGTDYTANNAALRFAGTAGETKSFTVTTAEDEVVELDETFTVGLTVSGASVFVAANDTATGTITNDDTATVTVGAVSGTEGGSPSYEWNGNLYTNLILTATLDKAVQGGFMLSVGTSSGTATMYASGNDSTADFGANRVAFNFQGSAGERYSFEHSWASIYQDEVAEGTETFGISYSLHPSGPSTPVPDGLTVDGPATGSIRDDDSAELTIADASAVEGDAISFTVTLDTAVQGGLTVAPVFTDGTATEGTDYSENTAALSFTGAAGEQQTFTVATTEDAVVGADETFTVSLRVMGTSATVTATNTATGTIVEDDSAAVTIDDAVAIEGQALRFTVTLDNAVQGGLHGEAFLHRRNGYQGHRLYRARGDAELRGQRRGDADLHRGDDQGRGRRRGGDLHHQTHPVRRATGGDGDGHGDGNDRGRRRRGIDDRGCFGRGGRLDHLRGDAEPGCQGRCDSGAFLKRWHRDEGYRLHREPVGAEVRR